MRTLLLSLTLILLTSVLFGQSEFVVNTTQDSTQRDPHVAVDSTGAYIVVWKSVNQVAPGSKGDIYFQRFNSSDSPVGSETLVNTVTAGDQTKPVVAMAGNGDFVVAWASFTNLDSAYDIKAKLYKSGVPVGPEFFVNTYRPFTQTNPSVAMTRAGSFVIVWDSWFQDGSDRGVYCQRFDANGSPLGSEFLVNVTTAYSQARPAVRYFGDGRFIVVWESWKQDAPAESGYGVFARVFNADGSAATGEFQVNTYTSDYQWYADVETFDDNGFAIVWCSWGEDGDGGAIALQRFDAAAQKVGPEVIVNTSTAYYQWLPKVRKMPGGGFCVVWSSWKQDGDREGVYAQMFNDAGRKTSFETRLNTYTASFQWEPDFFTAAGNQLMAVWSSWGQTGHDYDVVRRRVVLTGPEGYLNPSTYGHTSGRSTTQLIVHVVDSLALTGNTYEVMLDSLGKRQARASIRNTTTGDTLVQGFMIDRGEGILYLTPQFQGVAVEVVPEFDFALNTAASYFVNHSGTNVQVGVLPSTVGTARLAPLDAVLVWGNPDTLANGTYAAPLDTAIGTDLIRNVAIPFMGWNLTDGVKMEMLVYETKKNQRWDPGERIIFRTPSPYRLTNFDTHAEVKLTLPGGPIILPRSGDSTYLFTIRPIRPGERYAFNTLKANILDVRKEGWRPFNFELFQNFPNPFNPSTEFEFRISDFGLVRLKVFDVLGREVSTLINETKEPGSYRVRWNAAGAASGVYFCRLESGGRMITRKMLLLK
jgi:hypothetical protein